MKMNNLVKSKFKSRVNYTLWMYMWERIWNKVSQVIYFNNDNIMNELKIL